MENSLLNSIKEQCVHELRKKFKEHTEENETVKWSSHSLVELDSDCLTTDEIKGAVDSMELVELFWGHGFASPKLTLYLNLPGKPPVHIVVLYNEQYAYVKTGYLATDPQKFSPDGKTRIRKFER